MERKIPSAKIFGYESLKLKKMFWDTIFERVSEYIIQIGVICMFINKGFCLQ